jgi:hypothetical protein
LFESKMIRTNKVRKCDIRSLELLNGKILNIVKLWSIRSSKMQKLLKNFNWDCTPVPMHVSVKCLVVRIYIQILKGLFTYTNSDFCITLCRVMPHGQIRINPTYLCVAQSSATSCRCLCKQRAILNFIPGPQV